MRTPPVVTWALANLRALTRNGDDACAEAAHWAGILCQGFLKDSPTRKDLAVVVEQFHRGLLWKSEQKVKRRKAR
jgi:hypothetical protein